ncbi:hypothetical protein IAD21_00571 [Abditibacteriota bacterium]|nr:hypothetical protein IAD21_00571 [Abditibacteriota bacterium]
MAAPWPKGSDPEAKLRLELKALLTEAGLKCAIQTRTSDRITPATQVIILEAEETRMAMPWGDPESGKDCDCHSFEVTLDVVGDDRTPEGQMSKAASTLFEVFRQTNYSSRNNHGIYTATIRKDKNAQSDIREMKNPFIVRCDTITFVE